LSITGGEELVFSEKLAKLQAEKFETNYRLAKSIGVHQTTVAKWRSGDAYPRLEHLRKIAEHYGCAVDDLLSEDT
jgi:transcriptional regulator with XRE-family HTH domain